MQASAYILKHAKILCIFPEGERSIDGELKDFKKGIGVIGKELNVPLVPVYIKGAFKAWPRTERFMRLNPILVRFGRPVLPSDLGDSEDAISEGIRKEVLKLYY